MEGDGIAGHGHRAASVTYFRVNSKWTVVLIVTYGTDPVIPKAYMKWNNGKVFAE